MTIFKKLSRYLVVTLGIVIVTVSSTHAQSGGKLVEPSATVPLTPGDKIAGSDFSHMVQPFVIQRLTERTYWIYAHGYNSTVVIGKRGVMVIDAPRDGRGAETIQAIRTLTDLPINTLVYSHYHFDHVGDAQAYVDEAERTGTRLRIVATASSVEQIERYGKKIPVPTKIIRVPRGKFRFEDMVVEMGTSPSGHSVDNSWLLLKDERVLHVVDMVHPGAIVFPGFGLAEDLLGYEHMLKELLALDWNILSAGHNNIGSRADVELVLEYMQDIRTALGSALSQISFMPFVKDDQIFFEWFMNYRDGVVANAVETLRPKWGSEKAFDVVTPANVDKMMWHLYMH